MSPLVLNARFVGEEMAAGIGRRRQEEPTGQTVTDLQKQQKDLKLPKAPSGIRLCDSVTREHLVAPPGLLGAELEISSSLILG